MLLQNPKHEKYHSLGPKDLTWPSKDESVAMISITKQTVDNEQWHFQIPVSANDTREELDNRIGAIVSLGQERMEDVNKAWMILDEQHKAQEAGLQEESEAGVTKIGKRKKK